MTKRQKQVDALAELLSAAPSRGLADLLIRLASTRPDVCRECFDYLKKHVPQSDNRKKLSEGEILLALWFELDPDLSELDEYGGGDYEQADHVADLLYKIEQKLSWKNIDAGYRRELLDKVLPYNESGNAGLDDALYDLAYATCYDDNDLRLLAEVFEAMGGDWKIEHARRIYRQLGDRDKYLELRSRKMTYSANYYDLASFYWKAGVPFFHQGKTGQHQASRIPGGVRQSRAPLSVLRKEDFVCIRGNRFQWISTRIFMPTHGPKIPCSVFWLLE